MIKRTVAAVTAAFLILSPLVDVNSKQVSASDDKTINFYDPFYFEQADPLVKFIYYAVKKFEKVNPDIHMNVHYGVAIKDALSGEAKDADVGFADDSDIKSNSENLMNLSSIAEEEKNDLIPSTVKEEIKDGRQIGIPFFVSINEFAYNKNMIKEPPKNFDELISMAKNHNKNGAYGLNMNFSNYYSMGPWIREFGDFGFKDVKSGTTTFADKWMIDYFKYIDKINRTGICPQYYKDTMFEEGKAAFSNEYPCESGAYTPGDDIKKLDKLDIKLKGKYGIMPFPSMNENNPVKPDFSEEGFFIPRDSKCSEEAKKFIKFMTSKEIQDQFQSYKLYYVPVNKNVNKNANLKTIMDQVAIGEPVKFNIPDHTVNDPQINNANEAISSAYYNAVNNIINYTLTPENAAKQAYNDVLTAVRKHNKQKINENDLFIVDKTPPQKPEQSNKNVQSHPVKWQQDKSSYFFKEDAGTQNKNHGKKFQIKDLPENSTEYPYVQKLLNEGVIFLDKLKKINLNQHITRNDFSKLMWNIYLKQKSSGKNLYQAINPFADVKTNDEYTKYILAAKDFIPYYKENGKNYFKGNEQITREAAITSFLKLSGINAVTKNLISEYKLSDENDISRDLKPYMVTAIDNKWIDIKSYSNKNYLCPKHPMTLGELVTLLQNVYEILNPGNPNTIYGNSFSNAMDGSSGGFACQSGNKIFFTNPSYEDGLYEADEDGTHIKRLLKGDIQSINCDGDWIYFVLNRSLICKVKNDGTMRKVIYSEDTKKYGYYNIMNMIRIKNRLYFLENPIATSNSFDQITNFMSMNLDGSDYKAVTNNTVSKFVQINDYVYYINDSDFYTLYRMKSDGTSVEKISDEFDELKNLSLGNIYAAGGNIIVSYSDYKNNKTTFYALNADNHSITKLNMDGSTRNIEFVGNNFYYCSNDKNSKDLQPHVFMSDSDINKTSKLINDKSWMINVVGEWIYYQKLTPNPKYVKWDCNSHEYLFEIWRVKLDGSKKQKVISKGENSEKLIDESYISSADKTYISQRIKNTSGQLTIGKI